MSRPGRTPENPGKMTDEEHARALSELTPEYHFVALHESIESPKKKVSTFTFSTDENAKQDGGFEITKDALGWVHVFYPPTGDHLEIPPSNVKVLRRRPVKSEAPAS